MVTALIFGAAVTTISTRIQEEEDMLSEHLGDVWTEHAADRWRMFPLLW